MLVGPAQAKFLNDHDLAEEAAFSTNFDVDQGDRLQVPGWPRENDENL
jgi:hypothetical protein